MAGRLGVEAGAPAAVALPFALDLVLVEGLRQRGLGRPAEHRVQAGRRLHATTQGRGDALRGHRVEAEGRLAGAHEVLLDGARRAARRGIRHPQRPDPLAA